jgi:hypothetical protein
MAVAESPLNKRWCLCLVHDNVAISVRVIANSRRELSDLHKKSDGSDTDTAYLFIGANRAKREKTRRTEKAASR